MNTIDFDKYRQIGDSQCDEVVSQLFVYGGMAYLRQLIGYLSNYQDFTFAGHPQILQDFIEQHRQLPENLNKKNVVRACQFYRVHQQAIGMVLGCYSLPYCYLGADGSQVLYLSERIRKDTYKRLKETGQFLKNVMNYDNWQDGKIALICLKVRLMHSVIRLFTMHSGQWNMAWGYPICQEDMAGTNGTFSFIMIKGLRKMGYVVDESDERAYIETWNYIGEMMGVCKALHPQSWKDAVLLDKVIAQRQFKESRESQILANSLINTFQSMTQNKFESDLVIAQFRYFLGDEHANMLGISKNRIPKQFVKVLNNSNAFLSNFFN
ncbi:MAG: oxygenase MpaB family protein [Spirosomataceae bacterium]